MNEPSTVPARLVAAMLGIAHERRCDTALLLARVGIDPQQIAAGQPVTPLQYGELYHQIIELVQDEWFAMFSGGQVPRGAIRLLCQTVVHCKTLQLAMDRANAFYEVCRGFKVKPIYEQDGSEIIVRIAPLSHITRDECDALLRDTPLSLIKSTLSVWHGFLSWLIGKQIPQIGFYYAAPAADGQQKHGQTWIHDDADFYGFSFDARYLSYPVIQGELNIEEFIRKAPYFVFSKERQPADEGIAHKVKAIIAKSIGMEFPNAPDVAEILNLSSTTLHRRLSQEHTSFQALKDESRMEAAIHYLNCPELSTTAIAELVGFENPSTFFRAFKKWTGVPPGEYRKTLMGK